MDEMTSELLNGLAKSIWLWCRKQNIFLSAQHVPGIENVTAGYKSRNFNDTNEWMLKKDIFVRICSQFFNPDIDIFVSRLNHQIDNYASWSYDPEASFMMLLLFLGRIFILIYFHHLKLYQEFYPK